MYFAANLISAAKLELCCKKIFQKSYAAALELCCKLELCCNVCKNKSCSIIPTPLYSESNSRYIHAKG